MNPDNNSGIRPEDSPAQALLKTIEHYTAICDDLREKVALFRAASENHYRWYEEEARKNTELQQEIHRLTEELLTRKTNS